MHRITVQVTGSFRDDAEAMTHARQVAEVLQGPYPEATIKIEREQTQWAELDIAPLEASPVAAAAQPPTPEDLPF